MMRHAMGIIREMGPDLKSNEVNGGFPSCFPTSGSVPQLCTSLLHQKMLLPVLYVVHWDGFAELITIGNRIHIPSNGCSSGVPGLTCHQVCSVTLQGAEPPHTHTYSGYSNTKVAKKHISSVPCATRLQISNIFREPSICISF